MDWNWFFSSLAQSAAAMVAIFSGFIISTLLAAHSKMGDISDRAEHLYVEQMRLKDAVRDLDIKDHVRRWNGRELAAVHRELTGGQHAPAGGWTLESILATFSFSKYSNDADLRCAIIDIMEVVTKGAQAPIELLRMQKRLPMFIGHPGVPRDEVLVAQARVIDEYARQVKHHIRTVGVLHPAKMDLIRNVHRARRSLAMVLAMFAVGVIWPLALLPAPHNLAASALLVPPEIWSAQGILLGTFGLCFAGVVIFLYRFSSGIKAPVTLELVAQSATLTSFDVHLGYPKQSY